MWHHEACKRTGLRVPCTCEIPSKYNHEHKAPVSRFSYRRWSAIHWKCTVVVYRYTNEGWQIAMYLNKDTTRKALGFVLYVDFTIVRREQMRFVITDPAYLFWPKIAITNSVVTDLAGLFHTVFLPHKDWRDDLSWKQADGSADGGQVTGSVRESVQQTGTLWWRHTLCIIPLIHGKLQVNIWT